MPTPLHSILVILLIAGVTFLLRFAPFALFGGKRGMPRMIEYLGRILPPAIMAVLVVYCLKPVSLATAPHGLPEFLSVAVVAALHLWKRNFLISIAGGTLCYMILVQVVFL